MRVAWKAPVALAIVIAAVLLVALRPSDSMDIATILIGSLVAGFIVTWIGTSTDGMDGVGNG